MHSILERSVVTELSNYQNIYLGLSGGLDSVVLMHLLLHEPELQKKIIAIHVNHGISPNAHAWQLFCENYCNKWHVPFIAEAIVSLPRSNLEAHARDARYQIFRQKISSKDVLVLAHHLQDQIETILYQLIRGSGIDGLCAMPIQHDTHGFMLIRPLLKSSKDQLRLYAQQFNLMWIEDESNMSLEFDRNYLRHEIIPLLKHRWPEMEQTVSRVSQHAVDARQNLYELAQIDYPFIGHKSSKLPYSSLKLSARRLQNVIWWWLKTHHIKGLNYNIISRIMNEMVNSKKASGQMLHLPKGTIYHYKRILHWTNHQTNTTNDFRDLHLTWHNFPEPLILPYELGVLRPIWSLQGFVPRDISSLEVRWRQGGEVITWRQQTKVLKKLLQAWNVPAWERSFLPLLFINNQLAAVADYAISDLWFEKQGGGYQLIWERYRE